VTGVDACLGTQNPNHQQLHPEARTKSEFNSMTVSAPNKSWGRFFAKDGKDAFITGNEAE